MNFFNLNKIISTNNGISSKRWCMVASFLVAFLLTLISLFIDIPQDKHNLIKDLIDGWLILTGASGGFVLAERGKWFNKIISYDKNNNNSTDNNT